MINYRQERKKVDIKYTNIQTQLKTKTDGISRFDTD